MILVASASALERAALTESCRVRGWDADGCESLLKLKRALRRQRIRLVIARHRLADGYTEDIVAALRASGSPDARLVTLMPADTGALLEARQIALGADCVLRDPVRTEVLLEYVARLRARMTTATPEPAAATQPFAGGWLQPDERTLRHGHREVKLTPREAALARRLLQSAGTVVRYEDLFEDVLDRRFDGDTSNMRVLLGKLCVSAQRTGLAARAWVQVIPKLGYRYADPRGAEKKTKA